jgi:prepilin-type N-terminal cleavage/methylation domain-containing protein
METQKRLDSKGITLIELLVVLVISTILIGGIYRLFITQSKVYTIQDQVVEVQQNTRGAMELLLKDLRMTGFDNDRTPAVPVPSPPLTPDDHAITVSYEHNNALRQVRYWVDAGSRLLRQETTNGVSNTEALLENVNALNFSYGIDGTDGKPEDGIMDDRDANQMLSLNDWVPQADVQNRKVIAVRVSLTARPSQVNPDLQNLAPRTLVSAITLRNLSMTW